MQKVNKTIVDALLKMAPGQFDMETVAASCGDNVSTSDVGKEVRRLNGLIVNGVSIKAIDSGRWLLVSLHNVKLIHGDEDSQSKQQTLPPLDEASCSASSF